LTLNFKIVYKRVWIDDQKKREKGFGKRGKIIKCQKIEKVYCINLFFDNYIVVLILDVGFCVNKHVILIYGESWSFYSDENNLLEDEQLLVTTLLIIENEICHCNI
jgi:hypothetical protein